MQKILLLEDDLNLNRGIALLLSREGYEVRQVYTIKEAKEAFQKGDYALVISDITLPDGTGLDFGRMVRAAGDIRTKELRQIITAAADGANCVNSAQQDLYKG